MADITVSAAGVVSNTTYTITQTGIAFVPISAGQLIYADAANSYSLRPASAVASQASSQVVGIALNSGGAGQPIKYASSGDITMSSTALGVGILYALSGATAGSFCPVADLTLTTATNYATIIGVSTSATVLRLGIAAANVIKV